MKYDVFISHSSQDKVIAERICEYLEENNIKCWIAPRDIPGGLPYARGIFQGIEESQVLLLVFSASSNRSRHVESEIDQAFNKGKVIIPFRIEDCPMSDMLSYYMGVSHHIDGLPVPDEAFERLKESVISNLPEHRSKRNSDEAYAIVARELNLTVEELKTLLKTSTNQQTQQSKTSMSGESGRYDMLQNAAGEILIITNYREGKPENPRIVYDGGDQALFYKSRECAWMLNNIAEEAREPLSKVDEVVVAEIEDDDVAREYKVPVRLVRSLKLLS